MLYVYMARCIWQPCLHRPIWVTTDQLRNTREFSLVSRSNVSEQAPLAVCVLQSVLFHTSPFSRLWELIGPLPCVLPLQENTAPFIGFQQNPGKNLCVCLGHKTICHLLQNGLKRQETLSISRGNFKSDRFLWKPVEVKKKKREVSHNFCPELWC